MSKDKNLMMPGRGIRRLGLSILILVAAFAAGFVLRGGGVADGESPGAAAESSAEVASTTWTCSMHPQIKLPKAGQCPICFMDLIPLESGGEDDLGPRTIVLSEAAVALAEIQTSPVSRRHESADVRLIGQVDYDETLFRTISAWVPGRIDELFVDYTGAEVTAGARLASLYSPKLYAAQVELLNAIEGAEALSRSNDKYLRGSATETVKSARERLRLWGLPAREIDALIAQGEARTHVDVVSPLGGVVVHKNALEGMYVETGTRIYTVADLSRVWVTLDAYESDLVWVRNGLQVGFTVEALPGEQFTGKVAFIDPVLDKRRRTVTVRLEVENGHGRLLPGMFVNATLRAMVGAENDGDDAASRPLLVPSTAPLLTGKRAVVYVREPDKEKPTFTGREVTLGPRVGDWYIVTDGLSEGDFVVTRGNFKIDSALQIQAMPSMMNPSGGGPTPGHDHGGPSGSGADHGGHGAAGEGGDGLEPVREQAPVSDVLARELSMLVATYLEAQSALAEDAADSAREAAAKMEQVVARIGRGDLDEAGRVAWTDISGDLEPALRRFVEAQDIATQRAEFVEVSGLVWKLVRRFAFTPETTLRLFHCPMANGNNGAEWIQTDASTANPYFGAAMFRCGAQTDSLAADDADRR